MSRTLKYVLLGLLNRKPMTGYDIVKTFGGGLGDFWHAKHSQVYPELKRLTEEKEIYFDVVQGQKMKTKVYTITDSGAKDFRHWLLQNEPLEPTPKDTFKLRVYLSDDMETRQLHGMFNTELDKRLKKLQRLKGIYARKYDGLKISAVPPENRGDYMVLVAAIKREEAYVRWIYDCLSWLEVWEGVDAGIDNSGAEDGFM